MTEDNRHRGRFQKGHKGINKHSPEYIAARPTPSDDTDTDLDTAILTAASSFGKPGGKTKVGLAGYCNNLRDTRPQDFALLVAKAHLRRSFAQQSQASAIPITVEFATCPAGYFLPGEEARALWAAKTGERPVLVVDNDTTTLDDTFSDVPDTDPYDAG